MPRRSQPAARKSLGQHFLRDSGIILDIVGAVRVPEGGIVVEIGAGTGQLTSGLLDAQHEVLALEIEERLVEHLRKRFHRSGRLTVVEDDGRSVDYGSLVGARPFAVAGNLPYFAANPILRHLLESPVKPVDIVIMVQREVARRIAAPAGRLSLLGVSVQVYAGPEFLFDVPPEAFDPPPKVWSTVLRLTPRAEPRVPLERIDAFFDLVSKTFRNPRKHLHNALTMGVALPKGGAAIALAATGIDPMRRPETLAIDEWLSLLDATEDVRRG
ncbi:MAG: 16S rRNA (adenine(1518)-N(6)/adenine(1519)-N(6))-dimethyltransferase RsmA [Dehalococcoidia bacterium]|nr:ribosomal RNA small subunit methyltransferase A [Dehalococcoidia bacterium]MCA9829724.1 ribosomal RNA small subunit methyltransferase A [Dehalococcoidia bacterium]